MRRNARPAVIAHRFASASADPYYAQVALLMHFDGSNASTTFLDNSQNAWTLTAGGNAQLSTANPKYGSACGIFDSSGDYVDAPTNAAFTVTTGDFTIEAWIKPDAPLKLEVIMSTRPTGGDRGFSFYISSGGKLSFNAWDGGGSAFAAISSAASVSTAAYSHVAITRVGSVYTLWINGVADGTTTVATTIGASTVLSVGRDRTTAGREFQGLMDELRYTNGIGRYTAAFTPPGTAFVP